MYHSGRKICDQDDKRNCENLKIVIIYDIIPMTARSIMDVAA